MGAVIAAPATLAGGTISGGGGGFEGRIDREVENENNG